MTFRLGEARKAWRLPLFFVLRSTPTHARPGRPCLSHGGLIMQVRSRQLSSRAEIFSRVCLPVLFFLFSSSLSPQPLYAQGGINYTGNGGRQTIQGRIYFPSGRSSDLMGMKIRLESAGSGSGDLVTLADPNGTFAFKNLTGGTYY